MGKGNKYKIVAINVKFTENKVINLRGRLLENFDAMESLGDEYANSL
jgi:hypothetical protein